jgi:hypothetical protein
MSVTDLSRYVFSALWFPRAEKRHLGNSRDEQVALESAPPPPPPPANRQGKAHQPGAGHTGGALIVKKLAATAS